MNGKTAKLLRKLSGLGNWAEYALNKTIWNAHRRPMRGALRQRALAIIAERQAPIVGTRIIS